MTGGIYQQGAFSFNLEIPSNYPFQAPSVTCITRVWHPNIDLSTGKVLLPILEKDWRPVLSINTVVFGLQLLFLEPNPEYAANPYAAEAMMRDEEIFKAQVKETLNGGTFFGLEFPCHSRSSEPSLNLKRKSHDASLNGGGVPECELKCDLEAMCIQDPLEEWEEERMAATPSNKRHKS